MTYLKPQLFGYKAILLVQATGPNAKTMGFFEPGTNIHSQPAYEADE